MSNSTPPANGSAGDDPKKKFASEDPSATHRLMEELAFGAAGDLGRALLNATSVEAFVRIFFRYSGVWVGADEKLFRVQSSKAITSDDDKRARLGVKPLSKQRLVRRAHTYCTHNGLPYKKTDLASAFTTAIEEMAVERRIAIWLPLCPSTLTVEERERADKEFARFADLIDAPAFLSVAVLRHWMWMTKRRALREPVSDHLMLVFFNPVQGTGKTEFVKKLLKPLAELATDPVNFDQITNDFARDIFAHFSAVNLDDLGYLPTKKVEDLKRKLTADAIQMRPPASDGTERVEMRPTFIGTSNKPITMLIPDDTGHRRFVILLLKNGTAERGGDAAVRAIVNDLDYTLMWRSVCETEERSPIKDVLKELVRYQAGWAPVHPVLAFLRKIDPADTTCKWMARARHPRGLRAKPVWEQFVLDTGSDMTLTAFGRVVQTFFSDPSVPFCKRYDGPDCNVYVWKPAAPAA